MARLNAIWDNFSARGQTWDSFWSDGPTRDTTPVDLTIQDITNSHSISNIVLTQTHVLVVSNVIDSNNITTIGD